MVMCQTGCLFFIGATTGFALIQITCFSALKRRILPIWLRRTVNLVAFAILEQRSLKWKLLQYDRSINGRTVPYQESMEFLFLRSDAFALVKTGYLEAKNERGSSGKS